MIASSQWQRLIPHGHQGSLNRTFNTMKFVDSVSVLKVHIKIIKAVQLGEKGDSSINKIGDEKLEWADEFVQLGIQFTVKKYII